MNKHDRPLWPLDRPRLGEERRLQRAKHPRLAHSHSSLVHVGVRKRGRGRKRMAVRSGELEPETGQATPLAGRVT
jgi:hypothetical protein